MTEQFNTPDSILARLERLQASGKTALRPSPLSSEMILARLSGKGINVSDITASDVRREILRRKIEVIRAAAKDVSKEHRDANGKWASNPAGEPKGKIKHAVLIIDGKRYKGASHMSALMDWGMKNHKEGLPKVPERHQGFETESGHFLDREEAAEYGLKNNLVKEDADEAENTGKLRSEMLHLKATNGKLYVVETVFAAHDVSGEKRDKSGKWTGSMGSGNHQTDNPKFKEWFGESKVVDEKGNPLVVYKAMHPYDYTKESKIPWSEKQKQIKEGTFERGPLLETINRKEEFPAFNRGESGVKIAGFFGDKQTANLFAKGSEESAIYPCYIKMEKPFIIDAKGEPAGKFQFGDTGIDFRNAIRSGKYDGVIIKNTKDENTIYVALEPTQIKSAIGNSGNWDKNDPRITAAEARTAEQDLAPELREHNHIRDEAEAPYRHAMARLIAAAELAKLKEKKAASKKKKEQEEAALIALWLLLMQDASQEAYATAGNALGGLLTVQPPSIPLTDAETPQIEPQNEIPPVTTEEASGYFERRKPLIQDIPNRVMERLDKAIDAGRSLGEDDRLLRLRLKREAQAIQSGYGEMVARNEAQATYTGAQIATLRKAGFATKIWVTMDDDRVRESHIDCGQQGEVPLDKPFMNGLMYPCEPDAPPEETCNCRCWLIGGRRIGEAVQATEKQQPDSKVMSKGSLSVGRGEKLPISKGAGLTAKGRAKYNRAHGSNLKAPAPHPKTEKDAARRRSFCARMKGVVKHAKGDAPRAKASLKRWNCH